MKIVINTKLQGNNVDLDNLSEVIFKKYCVNINKFDIQY